LLNSGDFSSSICRKSLAASSYPCSLAFQSWKVHYEWVLSFFLKKRINCKGIPIKVPCEHSVLLQAISYTPYLPPSWICFTCLRTVYLKYDISSTYPVQNIDNIKNVYEIGTWMQAVLYTRAENRKRHYLLPTSTLQLCKTHFFLQKNASKLTLTFRRPTSTYVIACRKTPLENSLYINAGNNEIYCILKTCCIMCFIFHRIMFIA
jgi:hypothetical protein